MLPMHSLIETCTSKMAPIQFRFHYYHQGTRKEQRKLRKIRLSDRGTAFASNGRRPSRHKKLGGIERPRRRPVQDVPDTVFCTGSLSG